MNAVNYTLRILHAAVYVILSLLLLLVLIFIVLIFGWSMRQPHSNFWGPLLMLVAGVGFLGPFLLFCIRASYSIIKNREFNFGREFIFSSGMNTRAFRNKSSDQDDEF